MGNVTSVLAAKNVLNLYAPEFASLLQHQKGMIEYKEGAKPPQSLWVVLHLGLSMDDSVKILLARHLVCHICVPLTAGSVLIPSEGSGFTRYVWSGLRLPTGESLFKKFLQVNMNTLAASTKCKYGCYILGVYMIVEYLSSSRSDSQTVQAVLAGVKASMTKNRKRDACRSKMEVVLEVPSCKYISPAEQRSQPSKALLWSMSSPACGSPWQENHNTINISWSGLSMRVIPVAIQRQSQEEEVSYA